jgi:protease I
MRAQEGIEEVEPTEAWKAVKKAGGTPELIAPEAGEVQANLPSNAG